MTEPAEKPTETPSAPETPTETSRAAVPSKPGRGAALPPTPAPPEARPGKKRGRPSNAEKAAREAGAAPSAPTPPAPSSPAGPPPWRDPATLDAARPTAESLTVVLHVVSLAKGGAGLDEGTAPLLAEAVTPCVAKYGGEVLGPEFDAAAALATFGLYAMRSPEEAKKADPEWKGPPSPIALLHAMRAARKPYGPA